MSYLHLFSNAGPETWHFVTGEDRFLVNLPIFHIGGVGLPFVMLARGGSIALWENFRTDEFWDFVRATECTACFLLGVMATFLLKEPASARDRDHKLRLALMVPLTESAGEFHTRFGIDIYTIFNMTEISTPILSEPNPTALGTCGTVRPHVDVRLVDENDCEVPAGTVGEMIVRTDRPWAMMHGYYNNPEATARAWRNGWFHTGDAFRRDEAGSFFFIDRIKDAIRRRGENISSFEVEAEIVAHPDVQEARRHRRAERIGRRRGNGRRRARRRPQHRPGGPHHLPRGAPALFHGAALCARDRGAAEDADGQGTEGRSPPRRRDGGHVGPRDG